MGKRILVIAPHPDDDVLGCGGIMKKYSQAGHKVYVLISTRGASRFYSEEKIENVRTETLRAHTILGVTDTIFLDFPAPDLGMVSQADISQKIARNIQSLEIDTLYLPHGGDIHHDHKIVFNAGLVASRPIKGQSVKRIFSYETLSETEWAAPFSCDNFIPTNFINISDVFAFKLRAMECFKSQLREFPSSRSLKSIEALSNYRGSTVGFDHAEAFMTIRIIDK